MREKSGQPDFAPGFLSGTEQCISVQESRSERTAFLIYVFSTEKIFPFSLNFPIECRIVLFVLNFQGFDSFQQFVVDPVRSSVRIQMDESDFAEVVTFLIVRRPAEIIRDGNALFHHGFQFAEIGFADIAGECVFLPADACRHADDFSENSQSPHDPDT